MGSCLSCPEKESIPDNHQSKFKVSSCPGLPQQQPHSQSVRLSAHTLDYSLMMAEISQTLLLSQLANLSPPVFSPVSASVDHTRH